ncbi:ABC transporter substrate-binding protein [Georgenia deserti]|uniref:ABC transporter substrate-binding protein n=1 Tax=Georgenia deserti TaxID=2093781 RepID=A0ABW4L1Q5_9MICO
MDLDRASTTTAVRRRDILRLGGVGLVAASLSSCGFFSTDPTDGHGGGAGTDAAKGPEAPSLAQRVEAGDLPPLEERLPATPMVLEPLEEMGRYGGDLRMLMSSVGSDLLNATIGYENLVRWKSDATQLTQDQVIPNVAEDFEISPDGTEFTFTLRDGLRWSDGEPFTAEDILFWFHDVISNEELTPDGLPEWLNTGGEEPLVVEQTGERTVVFRFSAPNGLFLVNLATQRGDIVTGFPRHYLEQFHKDYADDIDGVVEQEDAEDWVDLFFTKADRADPPGLFWQNPEVPTLNAWVITEAITSDSQRVVAERNPYYWKTDPDGSQLPYLDRVTFHMVTDPEAQVVEVTNGNVDLVERGINTLRNKPVFADAREDAGIEFFDTIPQQMNQMIIMVNLTHQDPALREVFSDRDFRIGLSYALDRQEIIDTVFARQGEPWQAAPRPESPFYNETLATQYTEHDLELAAEHLDRVVPDTDADGMRLRPDGRRLRFQIEVSTDFPDLVDALEFVRNQWAQVGVDIGIKSQDATLFGERMEANAHDACVWIGGGGLGPTLDPFYYMPYNFNTRYAMPWYRWYINPDSEQAEEPPEPARRQLELYGELLRTPDQQGQIDLMAQITDIAAEQFYCMGVALREREYGVAATRVRNIPSSTVNGWLYAGMMPANPQQYFVTE